MNNFAVLDIAYHPTPTTVSIVTHTNNPCHLTCYYSDKEPRRHRTSRNQRGLTLPWGAYYCFVSWLSVEQTEPGDTLIHTFYFPTWVLCQTKWLVFRGTVSGVLSPSVSPIFKYHSTARVTFYPILDGYVRHFGIYPNWADLVDAPGIDANYTHVQIWAAGIRGIYIVNEWLLIRGIYLFDTSSIPPHAQITQATFSIYGSGKQDQLNCSPDINLYTSNPASTTQLVGTDYSTLGSIPLCDTPITYQNFNPAGYNDFLLNSTGLNHIAKDGITKLGTRNANRDVAKLPPPAWLYNKTSGLLPWSREKGEAYSPKLTIAYH